MTISSRIVAAGVNGSKYAVGGSHWGISDRWALGDGMLFSASKTVGGSGTVDVEELDAARAEAAY